MREFGFCAIFVLKPEGGWRILNAFVCLKYSFELVVYRLLLRFALLLHYFLVMFSAIFFFFFSFGLTWTAEISMFSDI